jgi:hypothetical protein
LKLMQDEFQTLDGPYSDVCIYPWHRSPFSLANIKSWCSQKQGCLLGVYPGLAWRFKLSPRPIDRLWNLITGPVRPSAEALPKATFILSFCPKKLLEWKEVGNAERTNGHSLRLLLAHGKCRQSMGIVSDTLFNFLNSSCINFSY